MHATGAQVLVSALDELTSALTDDDVQIIIVERSLTLPDGTTIDGRGKTIQVGTPYLDSDGRHADTPSSGGVFSIGSGSTVTLSNMTLMGGKSTAAINNSGVLTLDNVTLTRSCRGLRNLGIAILVGCNLNRNAGPYGGGLLNSGGGKVVMDRCFFSENLTEGSGGGGAAENQGYMYLNNTIMSNNVTDEIGSAINNYGGRLYIMNSIITGNLATGNYYNDGALRDYGNVYAVNTIITDNKYAQSNGTITESDVQGGNLYYCIVGDTNGATLDPTCKTASGEDGNVFANYSYSSVYTGQSDNPFSGEFYHSALVNVDGHYITPIAPDGIAASGGTTTYFEYEIVDGNLVVKMSFDHDGENVSLGSLPTSTEKVTTNIDGSPRTDGTIGSSPSSTTAYYTVRLDSEDADNLANGTVEGVNVFGDTYASDTEITVTAIPNDGCGFSGWKINGSDEFVSTNNSYTFTLTQNTIITPVFIGHTHTWIYTLDDTDSQRINGVCTTEDPGTCVYHSESQDITFSAYTNLLYTDVTSVNSIIRTTKSTNEGGFADGWTYQCYKTDTENALSGGTLLPNLPTESGYYYMEITLGSAVVKVPFKLSEPFRAKVIANDGTETFVPIIGSLSGDLFSIQRDALDRYVTGTLDLSQVYSGDETYAVGAIGGSAFYNCRIQGVIIPSTVTTISSWAFEYCSSLKSVVFNGSPVSVGNYAFYGVGTSSNPCRLTLPDDWSGNSWSSKTVGWYNGFFQLVKEIDFSSAGNIDQLRGYEGTDVNIDATYAHSYTNGVAATLCLPYALTTVEGGSLYEFDGVSQDTSGKWAADMTEVTVSDSQPTEANKPYLFLPFATDDIAFSGTITSVPVDIAAQTTVKGDWAFKGIFETTIWDDSMPETLYGFAATSTPAANDPNQTVEAGQFVHLVSGASASPFHAYLEYQGDIANMPIASRRSMSSLPSSIDVRLHSENGMVTSVIQLQLDDDTNGYWYALDGRRLTSKPTRKGVYLHNGKKIVIK